MQVKSNKVAEEASKIGLQVNIDKIEVMKIPGQQQQQQQTTISQHKWEEPERNSLLHLPTLEASFQLQADGTDEDIKARIGKARLAFITP
ncbi:unnamed protein product [Trichobilharzia regenti]|nr:unnamed protein product [Trichobilharzia regenti]